VNISLGTIVWFVVYVLIAAIIFGALDYLIRTAPFVREEWKPMIRWGLLALAILCGIGLLLSFLTGSPVLRG